MSFTPVESCPSPLDSAGPAHPAHDHWHVADMVDQIRGGNELVWYELMDRFQPMMERTALRSGVLPSDLEDVVQRTFINLARKIDTLEAPERLAGWLKVATRRNATRFLETAYRMPSYDGPEFAWVSETMHDTSELAPDESVIAKEQTVARARLFGEVPEHKKTLLELLISNDPEYSYKQISEITGLEVNNIGAHRQRLVNALRTAAEAQGITFDDVA